MLGGVSFTESEETDTNLYGPSSATNHQQHAHAAHAHQHPHAHDRSSSVAVPAASPKSFLSSFSSHDFLGARGRDMGNSGNSHESSTFGSYDQRPQSRDHRQQQPPVSPHSTNHTTIAPNNNSTATSTATSTSTSSPRGFFRRHSGLSKFHSHDDNGVSPNSNSQGTVKTKRSLLSFGSRRSKTKKQVSSPAAASSATHPSASYSQDDDDDGDDDDDDDSSVSVLVCILVAGRRSWQPAAMPAT
mmetsp:Transcript_29218/g.53464  ORF Transcript_29218/g.53464 Transcript_29218/m.53464 type:complete len:244 (+) Transcript_29218:293-1024(+)